MQGGLKIKFPTSAASQHSRGFDMSLGNFGAPLYGGTLTYGSCTACISTIMFQPHFLRPISATIEMHVFVLAEILGLDAVIHFCADLDMGQLIRNTVFID